MQLGMQLGKHYQTRQNPIAREVNDILLCHLETARPIPWIRPRTNVRRKNIMQKCNILFAGASIRQRRSSLRTIIPGLRPFQILSGHYCAVGKTYTWTGLVKKMVHCCCCLACSGFPNFRISLEHLLKCLLSSLSSTNRLTSESVYVMLLSNYK